MGLAGESLVEANWLQPFADSLLKLKKSQVELSDILEKLHESLAEQDLNEGSDRTLNAARQKASECRQILADRLNELELFARRSANLSDRLYREVIASHMRPFADGVQGFPRMMRDLARKLGKQVKFEILGKSTPVDRDILEKLEAPLTHILRNAVDHGIEFPDKRLAAGKPAEGTVRLEATHRAGMLSITVSDDGRGVELEKLRQKIVSKGMVNGEMAAQLTEPELMEFLFLPGFSTASTVTEISGRGVGLDVVQSMVQEVGGLLRAVSQPGQGMTFHLQLPLTLSVIRTLLVEISGEPYAFPLTRIDRIVTINRSDIAVVENRQYFTIDEQNIGLVAAHQVLELNEPSPASEEFSVIVVSDRTNRYGLVVDRFLGERDLVVRPLDPRLGKVPDISAVALMEDGSPVLIVDVEDIIRSIDKLLTGGRLSKVSHTTDDSDSKQAKRILVVDDSITVREVQRKLLENKGYQVEVAVNGMDGWNAVRTSHYDLVITDIDMPRMNGIELVSQIKNHPNLKSLPVIIVSYKDREEDRLRGLEVGADYYLTKSSFHDDSLLNAVADLIC
jgi:two-component system sensor histidine kinase and response regulator WspE